MAAALIWQCPAAPDAIRLRATRMLAVDVPAIGPLVVVVALPVPQPTYTPALSRARRGEAINLESAVDMLPPELSPKVSDRTGEISEYKP
eukprot:CAMPEP_0204070552 /NCGR_PEP_ID=MMETSP0360-20130528/158653_1 /ASSEMBLY_ACC=CAM_ASM_000342 /TAXON_ID=268821 /ORGANISM="Scrippsiella Hangoei, Strain SHTV-5" /LENGTH=89 /DNA_ID=CAMNT_0051018773 /DNA_START=17 /DNA_END=283 /DNA_ORIENTATION=+